MEPGTDEGVAMAEEQTFTQRIEVAGGEVVDRIKALLKDSKARRVVLRDADGKQLIALPLRVGLAGGALTVWMAPVLAAVAAVGGAAARFRLDVERTAPPEAGNDQ
jgi:hypothetical protein